MESRVERTGRGGRVARAALGFFATIVPLALLEFTLAAFDFQYYPPLVVPLWGGRNDLGLLSERGRFQPHPYWFWELRPRALLDPATGERASASGLRGPEPAAAVPDGRVRVAALGDSSTFGMSVPESATFARRLESLGPYEVLNFGVPGYNAFQGLKLYEGRVRGFSPDVVIAAFGAINEMSPRDPTAAERFEITSRTSPRAAALSNALMRFRSYQLLRFLWAELRDEEDAAAEGQRRLLENMNHRNRGEPYKRNVELPTFRRVLRELDEAVRNDGGRLLLVSPPRSAQQEQRTPEGLDYTAAIFEVAEETGAPSCDVRAAFLASPKPRLLLDGVHPSRAGHQLYAETLAGCLEREGLAAGARAHGPASDPPAAR